MKEKVLVLSLAPGLGDFLVRIPAINLLSEYYNLDIVMNFPKSEENFVKMFFKENKNINFYLLSKKIHKNKFYRFFSFLESFSFVWNLKRNNYKFIVILADFHTNLGVLKHNILLLSFYFYEKYAISSQAKLPFLNTKIINLPELEHKRDKYFKFIVKVLKDRKIKYSFDIENYLYKPKKLRKEKNIIIAPGSKMPSHRWPYYKELLNILVSKLDDFQFYIVGTKDEISLVKDIDNEKVKLVFNQSLQEVYKLFLSSKLIVCNDSGLMHLGVISNTKVYAICGPGVYQPWCDYKDPNFYAFFKPVKCYPCRKWVCNDHICLKQWKAEYVANKILMDLNNNENK